MFESSLEPETTELAETPPILPFIDDSKESFASAIYYEVKNSANSES